MCGRYYIDDGIDSGELQEIIDAVNRHSNSDQVKTSGEIFPTDTVPIIANSRAMAPTAFAMSEVISSSMGKGLLILILKCGQAMAPHLLMSHLTPFC